MTDTLASAWIDTEQEPQLAESSHRGNLRFSDSLAAHVAGVNALLVLHPASAPAEDGPPAPDADSRVTSWTSGSILHWLVTRRNEGESDPELDARHASQVAAEQAVFPPNP